MEAYVSWDLNEDSIFDEEGNEVGAEEYVLIEKIYVPAEQRRQGLARKLLHETFGYVDIMGIQYSAVHTLRKIDYIAFREMYNNHLDTLDKNDFEEYQELEELLEIEEQLDND